MSLESKAKTTHELVCCSEDIDTSNDPFKTKWVKLEDAQAEYKRYIENSKTVNKIIEELEAENKQLKAKIEEANKILDDYPCLRCHKYQFKHCIQFGGKSDLCAHDAFAKNYKKLRACLLTNANQPTKEPTK
jgi:transcriptional regulator of heat shock response